ncbi:hypothetical protein L207DRAFT_468782 [Hyaloscypha variabilis F]|uniref:Zn(2)-C6 fungal-type domain-containing protein n=1 Tax=Hyaloscypha variabilis (strain UAMH 11265 / GT02V1 / F) TaxID=1149755 RepID=A0A2J6R7I4_HYAVF|nr:hypothetical protein L207DRAFT_468782 [Hyaloscypha variabilis F]
MPYPSAGCQTCRLRRIKCDETTPICQRCAKSGRVCQSKTFKKPSFSIHVENPYASGETKRPRGPRPRPRPSLTHVRPTLDVSSRALSYYLNYYLHELPDLPTISACMSECLTTWKASKRECDMVDLAVSAVALAIFARTQQNTLAAREAVATYGHLLRVAQRKITQAELLICNETRSDEFMLTVVLMAWYETTMHQPANFKQYMLPVSLHSWLHHDGAMAILKVWNDRLRNNTPSSITKQTRRGLLRSALLRNCSLPKWVRDGNQFGEHGIDLGFDRILVRVVILRHSFKMAEQNKYLEMGEIEEMTNEARELDEACIQWRVQTPNEWKSELHTVPTSWSRTDFYSSTVFSFARQGYAAIWIQYFALRMLINSTLLGLTRLYHPPSLQIHTSTYNEQCCAHTTQLQETTDSLVSTIPFSLGQFSTDETGVSDSQHKFNFNTDETIPPALALPIIWPLSVVSSLDGINHNHQLWIKSKLVHLGRLLGDGALQCAGTDQ